MSRYFRLIDYDAGTLREERTRKQGNNPPQGVPPLPEEQVVELLSGKFAWNMRGETPVARTGRFLEGPPIAELRQLEIMLTPHGFLKAALEGDATAITQPIVGPSDNGLSGNAESGRG